MNACSLNEFRQEQSNLRRETLAQLQAAEADIYKLCDRYDACREQFLQQLSAAPREVLYRYDRTRDAILDQTERLTTIRDFLFRKRCGERLTWKLDRLDHMAVARKVLKDRNSSESSEPRRLSRKELQRRAIEVLENQLTDLGRKLASHDEARKRLLDASGAVLHCLKEMHRRGIVPSDDRAVEFLEGLLLYAFWDELPRTHGKRSRLDVKQIESALASRPLQQVLQRALGGAVQNLAPGVLKAIRNAKRDLLKSAAKQLVVRLESWKDRPRYSTLAQAILALHFTFTSSRRGLGGIDADWIQYSRQRLEQATEAEMNEAVHSLRQKKILCEGEFEVFRYTPAVWRAVEKWRRAAKGNRSGDKDAGGRSHQHDPSR